jgi:hypothetical protein
MIVFGEFEPLSPVGPDRQLCGDHAVRNIVATRPKMAEAV